MKPSSAGLVLLGVATLTAALALRTVAPPAVVGDDAPAEHFSATRAWRHLERITGAPHAVDTDGHDRLRRYLADALEALGLEPQLQETVAVHRMAPGWLEAGGMVNVLARLPGRRPGKALLLVAHYDAESHSPGAGDDGAGVAALLETARALRAGAPLQNDVIFLFTDGEETGLLGARAFVDHHPWAADVGAVLNLEGRGSGGPALMFETSDGNGRLVAAMRRGVRRPAASSYSYEVYRLMANDTDFSVFRRAGMPGLNVAFLHGATAYHSAQDTLERLDPRSLQHHGEYALGLARTLGEADLSSEWHTRDAVYFNLGSLLVVYPGGLVWPLTAALALAFAALLLAAHRRGRLRLGALAGGMAVGLLGALATAGVLFVARGPLYGSSYDFDLGGATSNALNLLAATLLAAALALSFAALLRRWLGVDGALWAGLALWLTLATLTAALAPGASYLFALPLLAALIAGVAWLRRPPGDHTVSPLLVLLLALSAIVTAVLWAPTVALVGVALGSVAAAVSGLVLALLALGPLAPHLALAGGGRRLRWLAAALLAAAVALAAIVDLRSVHGPQNRRENSIVYTFDEVAAEARWLSFDHRVDAWTRHFLGHDPVSEPPPPWVFGWRRPLLQAPAPVPTALAPTRIELVAADANDTADTDAGGGDYDVAIAWPFDAHIAIVRVQAEGGVAALTVGGRRLSNDDADQASRMSVFYWGPAPEGLRLGVETARREPIEVDVVGHRYGFPALEGFTYPPRPEHLMPWAVWEVDATMVHAAARLDPATLAAEPPPAADPAAGQAPAADS